MSEETIQDAARRDAELVRRSLDGDRSAFGRLVERYQGKVYNLALRITADPQDAGDATQNAFLKAYQSLDRFDPSYKFFSWIYRIGTNEALNLVNRRRTEVPLDPGTASAAAGPEQRTVAGEAGRALADAVAELTPELRAVLVLRHFHGLAYREMSEILEIPVGRVKSRLFSARTRLRERLTRTGLGPKA